MATNDKNGVIYLEADEDITSAIDKLVKADTDRVEVVTAKRSTLFQSVINLRLLKKAAKDANKELVLVTSDRVATNLAGRLDVPIATQVGEAAAVPKAAAAAALQTSDDEIDGGTIGDDTPAKPAVAPAQKPEPEVAAPAPEKAAAAVPLEKPKRSKVPNIGAMQKRLLWMGAGVLAIILLFGLNYFLTSAKVTLFAQASQGNTSFSFTADPTAAQSSPKDGILSAQQLTSTKSLTASVQATGSKDNGTKANGTMTVHNQTNNDQTLVSGTRFQSSDGKVFRSANDVVVPKAFLVGFKPTEGTVTVNVTADENGDGYNLGPAQYSIPALGTSAIYGQGSQMQGGTSKTVKIITQSDIDKAKQSALDSDKAGALKDLSGKANKEQKALEATFQQNVTSANSNPDVGAESQAAVLTVQVSYTELAVQNTALSEIAKAEESKQAGGDSQIYDDGSSTLQFTSAKPSASGAQKLSANATYYYGPKIDTAALAKQLKGQKYSEAVDTASKVPGVDKAEVALSPAWATSIPGITSHIHIEIKVSGVGSK